MRTRIGMLALVTSAATACGGGSTAVQADGPLKAGVISGNNQVIRAAPRVPLTAQVGVQVVRLPNGQTAVRGFFVKAGDLILPPMAYAQTGTVSVPGAVTCQAAGVDPKHTLVAEIGCTTANASGVAYFNFLADSTAGTSSARIGYTDPITHLTVYTDSVKATVMAGPASPTFIAAITPILGFPYVLPPTEVVDNYGNVVPYRVVSDGRLVMQDTTTGTAGARTIVSGPDAQADFNVELRGAGNVLVGRARYRIVGGKLEYFMAGGVNTTP
jgi:hypothetical protein